MGEFGLIVGLVVATVIVVHLLVRALSIIYQINGSAGKHSQVTQALKGT